MAGESDSGLTGSKPYFFLSYARTPKRDPADREDPDRWVHKLYKDLCAAILQMTEAQPEEAGFMDRENQLGTEWSPELARALASCRVFVPLYSRRYFESDNCGKEWFAFARREVNQNARGDQIVSAIVPALWARLDQDRIPDVAQPIQYHHVNLGPRYSTEGFYGIMKLQKYRADYLLAVHRLAERIVQVADETSIHVERPAEYESLQSAFGPASAQRSAADQLRISVLAHDTSTLPPGRADHYYGSTPHTWSPYRPDYPQPLADYARDLAKKCLGCQPLVGAFEDPPSWAGNGRPVPPSLCLVDAWVTVSDAHQQQLRFLDEIEQPWVSVLVPWNIQDAELSDAEHDLRDRLVSIAGPQARERAAAVPAGRHRHTDPAGVRPDPAADDDDHAQEIPQGRPCIPAGRPRYCAPTAQDGGPSGPRRILMSDSCDGQIITFYSYKGGTGRTMALANVAWILASNSKRVLCVDWDLESPGLHKFFHPFLNESTVSATPGVIEIINEYASAAIDPTPRADDWHLEFAQVERHAVSLSWDFPGDGRLDFLSACRQNRDYSAAVCSLDWDNFYDRLGGGRFFRAMREDMKQKYDYVLIDSRTGLSDVADICTIELPDVLAVCFTLSDQSIDGAANVARQIRGRYRDRNIRVLPVPMRIEDGEKEKLDVGRALARIRFEGFPEGLSQERSAQYWASVEVPYKPFYAFEETLATFGDDPGSPTSLLASFERITDAITGGQVVTMQPIAENRRLQYRDAFTRRQPASSTQVFLSYAPEDRMWADWIEAVLTRSGFLVLPRSTVATAAKGDGGVAASLQAERELQIAPRAIAILSSAYLHSPDARSVWKAMSAADAAGTHRQLVPVRVSDVAE